MIIAVPSGAVNIEVGLDSHIRLDQRVLPEHVATSIMEALTFDNKAKQKALDLGFVNEADKMPDEIEMFSQHGHELRLPRGFLDPLSNGLDGLFNRSEIDGWWINDRRTAPVSRFYFNAAREIRMDHLPYQLRAIRDMAYSQQGILKAPPGAGKTIMALELIRLLELRALIIVNKMELADQWRKRAKQWLGLDIGLFGAGEERELPITIALQQTLWSRREKLAADKWHNKWGVVILDECHAATAQTYSDTMNRFPAFYRFGLSATPGKTGDFRIAETVLGPVCAEVTKDDLQEAGVLVRPRVEVIPTMLCHRHLDPDGYAKRNNWNKVTPHLVANEERNLQIATEIADNEGFANLIFVDRHRHIDLLIEATIDAGFPVERIFRLTGKESREERQVIIEEVTANGNCAVFSTIADEALDIPILDRGYLAWPVRNDDIIRQMIGRLERVHSDKGQPILYDFADMNSNILEKQYRRRRGLYRKEKLLVQQRRKEPIT